MWEKDDLLEHHDSELAKTHTEGSSPLHPALC